MAAAPPRPDTSRPASRAERTPWRRWRMGQRLDRRARLVALATMVLLGVFVMLAVALRQAAGTVADVAITRWVQQLDVPAFAGLMVAVSALGYWPWSQVMLFGAVAACLMARWYRGALFVVATQGAGWLASEIKLAIERPRPTSDIVRVLGQVGETSYPSGHVTSYVVFYGLLFFLVYVLMARGWFRTLMLIGLALLIGLVGVSRIYLGHHWVSDVIGGYALGTAYLLVLLELYRLVSLSTSAPPPRTDPMPQAPDDVRDGAVA